ncbi:MAG: DUF3592 domain-containing protein [Terracidiphilus sp.]
MFVEIWEHLQGYDKWIQTEATIKSSSLAEAEIGKVRNTRQMDGQPVDEWRSTSVLSWTDLSGKTQEAAYSVDEDSPLFQMYDGQRVTIRYNPASADQFYLRGVSQSKAHTWFKKTMIFLQNGLMGH